MPTFFFNYTWKSRFKCVNTLKNDFFIYKFYSTLQQWLLLQNQDRLSFDLVMYFAPGAPRSQNLLDSNLDYSVASDGAPVIEVVSSFSTFHG